MITEWSPKKRFSPSGEDRAKLAADVAEKYQTGMSVRAVAADLGLSYGLTHRLLLEGGDLLRSRVGHRAT